MKIYPHEDMPTKELCEQLHKQGSTWFNNRDLLLLEELIRRAQKFEGLNQESGNGQ